LNDNLYYWRIQRKFNNKWYAWVAPWSFRVDTLPPSPPDLYSPPDSTITNDNTPLLQWTTPAENSYPLTYQLMISRNTTFTDLVPGYNPSPWLSDNFHEVSELPDNTYYWKVKAKDNAGNEGVYTSYYWSFRIDTRPPAVPSPIATPQYVRPQPNLDWPAVTLDNAGETELTTPIFYQVYISTDPGFPPAATQTSGWITDDNWIATPATANNTTYYWKVSARDNIWNVSENSAVLSFVVDNRPPTIVTLYRPDNNADLQTLTVNFEWYHASDGESGIENYWIQIDDEPAFTSPFIENTLRPPGENSYLFSFSSYGTYYWRVKAIDFVKNENEWSNTFKVSLRRWVLVETWSAAINAPITGWGLKETWSSTIAAPSGWLSVESWTSTINAPIPAPVPVAPLYWENINDSTPEMRWENLQPADTYDLQVDNDNDWSNVTYSYTGLGSNTYTPFSPYPDGLYYWRVKMYRDNDNNSSTPSPSSPWSVIYVYRIDTRAPQTVPLVWPRDGENINQNSPNLDWLPAENQADGTPENSLPVTYELLVARDANFTDIVWSDNRFTADNRVVQVTLADNIYYWKVKAWDNAGNGGSWSEVRSFRVDTVPPAAPTLIWPTGGAWTNGAPNLDWDPVPENSLPIRYHIQIRLAAGSYGSPVRDNWTENIDNWIVTPPITTEEVYYWHVQAVDNAGNEGPWSSEASFQVDRTPPNKVLLYKPDNWSNIPDNLTVTLQWYTGSDPSPGSGVASYILEIDDAPDFETPIATFTGITENFYI
ncbi:MAG: hypothetical protein ACK4GQ_04670, partial [Candidatus Hadarchaeales archaeon]